MRQELPCEGCGQECSAGLCEDCGYPAPDTGALVVEAGLVAATWAADPGDAADVAAVAAHVRATLEADIEAARKQFLDLVDPGEREANPMGRRRP